MATADEYLQAAERAKTAGDSEAEAYFRAEASKLSGAAPPYDPIEVRNAAAKAREDGNAEAEAYFNSLAGMADATAKPDYSLENTSILPPPIGGYQAAPQASAAPTQDRPGDTAMEMASGPAASFMQFGRSLTNGGEGSPSLAAIAADPYLSRLPGGAQSALGFAGDVAGAGLSGIGTIFSGAVGGATEMVPGLDSAGEQKLAGDMIDMSMFAVPELAGVSSVASGVGRAAAATEGVKPVAAATEGVKPVAAAMKTPEEVGALVQKAASGSKNAFRQLAEEARANPEASAAAKRFGIDLPADVLSDSPSVKAAAGLTRSKVASEPEALWHRKIAETRDRADQLIQDLGGSPDIAGVSDGVKAKLTASQAELKKSAGALYDEVDAEIPKSTAGTVNHTVAALNGTIKDLGGIEGMSAAERKLYGMVNGGQRITYGRLLREKSLIGKALAREDSPYSSLDKSTLSRLYGALSDDQAATVAATGGADLMAKLKSANELTAKRKDLEERMLSVFGKDLAGSLAPKLSGAIKSGSSGDIGGFIRVMKIVPEEMRKEVVLSTISSLSKSRRASQPGFGLPEFSKIWASISANKPVRSAIGVQIGPQAMQVLDDINTVAQRVQQADAYVLRTGKANQAVADAMTADGLVRTVLDSSIGKRAAKGASIAVGTALGGPAGGVAADSLTASIMQAKPDALMRAGKLLSSDEFMAAAAEASERGAVSETTGSALLKSPAFAAWAKASGITDPQAWLAGALPTAAAGDAANANQSPYERLWQRYGQ